MMTNYQLNNKLNVHLIPQQDATSATFLVILPVGSRYEPEKLRGVSHYIEHLMFKGTKKRKNTLALTREIDRLGAQYNAFTGKEYTGYYIRVGVDYTETALDILSDMLFNSTFDPKEMEREKTVIVEEIKMYNDNPLMNIDNIFEEVMFDGPLGEDIAGTAKHVMSYKRPDVMAYKEKYYQPANFHLVVAGAQHAQLEQHIANYFGQEKNKKKPSTAYQPGVTGSSKKHDRIRVQQKDVDQAQLMLGYPAFPAHDYKRLAPLVVLDTILGGSMSSRLFIRIRERLGLAYMVRSHVETYEDTGYFAIQVGLDPSNTNKAIKAIQKEIAAVVEKGVTKKEVADAKTHLRGSQMLRMESSSSLANWYAKMAISSAETVSPDQWIDMIEDVTAEQVQRIAAQVFKPSQLRVAMIGNKTADDIVF